MMIGGAVESLHRSSFGSWRRMQRVYSKLWLVSRHSLEHQEDDVSVISLLLDAGSKDG